MGDHAATTCDCDLGGGGGSPKSRSVCKCPWIASRIEAIASSRVRPVETQPGRSGTYTLNVPSSAGSMMTVYSIAFILAPPVEEWTAMFPAQYREPFFLLLAPL